IRSVIAAREADGGRLASVFSLVEQADLRLVNKKVLECLAKAGAFDSLCPPSCDGYLAWRARLVAGLDRLLEHGARYQKDREQGQSHLFGDEPDEVDEADSNLPVVSPWTEAEALAYEKEALGLYMSGHSLQRYAGAVAAAGARYVHELTDPLPEAAVAGMVTGLRPLKTKRGDRMCVFMLEDETAKIEAVVFPDAFSRCGAQAVADAMVVVHGKFERDDESSRLLVNDIVPLEVIREKAVRAVEIRLTGRGLVRAAMRELAGILERYPGDRRVSVVIEVEGEPSPLRVRAATARRIKP